MEVMEVLEKLQDFLNADRVMKELQVPRKMIKCNFLGIKNNFTTFFLI